MSIPSAFIKVITHDSPYDPALSGLYVEYENGNWRSEHLAGHIIEWLPDFALTHSELKNFDAGNAVKLIQNAAKKIYQTPKYGNRGEFGEILLHIALRQIIGTECAVSKIYFKTGVNDTVKGFDAVHCVMNKDKFELWLGEVKFYKDLKAAITDVTKELGIHLKDDYLRNEFILLSDKINSDTPHFDKLKKLLDKNTSLDEVFDTLCIPVFLTYESDVVKGNKAVTKEFESQLKQELANGYKAFFDKCPTLKCQIHLFLFPLHEKKPFVAHLDKKLKQWQS